MSGLLGVTSALVKLLLSLNASSPRFGSFERTPAVLTNGMLAGALGLTVAVKMIVPLTLVVWPVKFQLRFWPFCVNAAAGLDDWLLRVMFAGSVSVTTI